MKKSDTFEPSRYYAAMTILVLMLSSLATILPLSTTLQSQFSLNLFDSIIKFLVLGALTIILFVGRPRLTALRRVLGIVAAITLLYAVIGAYSADLALGDTVILFFGALIVTIESLEPTLPTAESSDVFTVLSGTHS